ncbi:MAG TPA: hypothetical protein VM511_07435 [Luteolibacter sp.]|nr:hypothetical protein [Luteolibacter sp.]
MNRRSGLRLLAGLFLGGVGFAAAQDDPGKAVVGKVKVTVYYATNGDPAAAGPRFKEIPKEIESSLRDSARLDFKSYRLLGEDVQPLFRSYENWAQPLKPSDEVLVRFEAKSRPSEESMKLDLELWFSRKKILKTDASLERGKPLHVLGPEWRGGRLILSVALASG